MATTLQLILPSTLEVSICFRISFHLHTKLLCRDIFSRLPHKSKIAINALVCLSACRQVLWEWWDEGRYIGCSWTRHRSDLSEYFPNFFVCFTTSNLGLRTHLWCTHYLYSFGRRGADCRGKEWWNHSRTPFYPLNRWFPFSFLSPSNKRVGSLLTINKQLLECSNQNQKEWK